MALLCPRCQRANPDIAEFCYNDGALLKAGAAGQVANKLSREFVFPSGRRCQSFDDLAQGCQDEWVAARDLLKKGVFGQYFSAVGRLDLAKATQEAMAQPDADIALTTFLGALPVSRQHVPRLDINPRRILLGNLQAGESKQIQINISNQGQGTLQGSLKITEGGEWLKPAGAADGQCLIKTPRDQQIVLQVDTKKLQAAQTYGAMLTVVTNGGVVEVPVRMDVVAHPFPRPPFQGARTPRELAEKMRGQPKAAVPLLESGEVGRWFKSNAWNYPIPGTPAKGVAGVQQFFEAMGLSKPPPVQVTQKAVELTCNYPESARGQVSIQTPSKKWVYANVESDSPWLKVLTPVVAGPQQAAIAFEADSRQVPGSRAEANLKILANGGQTLPVRVTLTVAGAPKGRKSGKSLLQPVLAMAIFLVVGRLLLFPIIDFMGRGPASRTAAARAGVQLDEQSPLKSAGGWLNLPWNRIVLGSEKDLPRGLFNTRNETTDLLREEIKDFPGHKSIKTYAELAKAFEENPAIVYPALQGGELKKLFEKNKREDLARVAEKAVEVAKEKPTDAEVKTAVEARKISEEEARQTLPREKSLKVVVDALRPVDRVEYRHYYVRSVIGGVVFWTWWLGALAGGMILWRRGGAADLPWGLIAGSVVGIGLSATAGCIVLVGDVLPHAIWSLIGGGGSFVLLVFVWPLLLTFCWAILGALVGLLTYFLAPLKVLVLAPAQQTLSWVFGLCRLRGLATYFAPA